MNPFELVTCIAISILLFVVAAGARSRRKQEEQSLRPALSMDDSSPDTSDSSNRRITGSASFQERSNMLGRCGRFLRDHPIFTLFLVGLVFLIGLQQVLDHKAEQYRASPEGRAAAAVEARESEDEAAIMVAKLMVETRLRDPSSAQYMGLHVVRRDGKEAVCGFVNSKNGFGGMAGNEWFAVVDAQVFFVSNGAAAYTEVKRYCDRHL